MWPSDVSAALSTGDVGGHCLAGHERHETKRLSIDTAGPATIPDWPPDPAHLAHRFEMVTYDRDRYADEKVGCSGSDTISHSLDVHGKWEAWESLVVTTVLADPAGWCVDIGCQIGWYTLLAASAGHPTIAVDANPESLEILARNCELNGFADLVTPVLGWVGVDTPRVPSGGHVRFLKVDIEGLEAEAVRAFSLSFAAGDVDYALLELTPEFNDTWRDAHDMMIGYDMVAFQVPDKGDDVDEFAADPLGVTLRRPFDPGVEFDQLNVFFVRRDLL
jgi:SAM-dependent methyltransferase